jgi:ribosomal-protein-alanine N-acetyltransferase
MITVKEIIIETNKLVIRPFIQSDLLECFELMQDKELFKYLDWEVMSFEGFKGVFKWWIDLYETNYDGDFKYNFAIFLKDSNKFIGWGGFGVIDCFYPEKEIYYLIGKEFWGNGYATEAMTSLINYYFNTIGLTRIIALTKPENIASSKVIQKIGFKFKHLVSGLPEEFNFYNGEPYYSLTKQEYLQNI